MEENPMAGVIDDDDMDIEYDEDGNAIIPEYKKVKVDMIIKIHITTSYHIHSI